MDWNAYEQATGQQRPPWIDGVGNVNWNWNAREPERPSMSGGEARALANMPQVAPSAMRGGLMPQPQAPGVINPWRPPSNGQAWLQAGAQLRPQGF